jgi:serine/threonine-protein kinase HipA
MRTAKVFNFGVYAGELFEIEKGKKYLLKYSDDYDGSPISLTLPVIKREYTFDEFPPFFEGLLPEGIQLDALLRRTKIDRNDFFSILVVTGKDLVGSVTIEEAT